MTYEVYENCIKETIEQLNPNCKVIVTDITKNNGVKKRGICITNPEMKISANQVFYLEDYYTRDMDLNKAIFIAYSINKEMQKTNEFAECKMLLSLCNLSEIKKDIYYQLINTQRNEELLKTVPSRKYLDMSIVYRMNIDNEHGEIATAMISNNMMNLWKTTEEELWEIAKENTPKLFPVMYTRMSGILAEMIMDIPDIGITEFIKDTEDISDDILVVSNKKTLLGASVILYDDLLEKIYNMVGHNLYIALSSIHEFMIFTCYDENNINIDELRTMIKDINRTSVDKSEVLSDNVYCYDGINKELKIV